MMVLQSMLGWDTVSVKGLKGFLWEVLVTLVEG